MPVLDAPVTTAPVTTARAPIAAVVQQHADDCADLRHLRTVLVRAPHVKLRHLARLDERLAAHVDGLAVAGRAGSVLCTAALARAGAGEVFACTLRALDDHDREAFDALVVLGAGLPEARRGLLSALGWVDAPRLRGIVAELLAAPDAHRREIGIAACRLHRTDPGAALVAALQAPRPALRAAALRAAGELARVELLAPVRALLGDAEPAVALQAAWSACLLGDRADALDALEAAARRKDGEGDSGDMALELALEALPFDRAAALWRGAVAAADASTPRRLLHACAALGDLRAVPWLIDCMADVRLARLAGEAFSMLTGVDLDEQMLERPPPDDAESEPDDADAAALDEDDELPWPDRDRVQQWWDAHAASLPAGTRCLMGGVMGAAPSAAHCVQVLREGGQRQRARAARALCLARPGTPLFPIAAPAARQRRLLSQRPNE
jgi:uncharacterized protein (TIGR02270 family)